MQETKETTIQEFESEDNSRYEKYSEYEAPSGNNLQNVPAHWEDRLFQYWAKKKNDKGDEEERDFITLEHINSVTGDLVDGFEWEQKKSEEYYLFEPGDVLFGKLRPYLRKYYQVDRKGCCGTDLMVLSPKTNVQSRYLYYFLHSEDFIQFTDANSHGVKMPRSSWQKISSTQFSLPPHDEQAPIVEFLDRETKRIDNLINNKKELINLLREREEALITKMTTRGLGDETPTHKVQDEIVGELPKTWEESKLGNITTKLTNGYVGPTRDILTDEGVPYIQSTHISDGEIEFDGEFFVSEEWSKNHRTSKLRKGDVLLVQTGDVGESAVVREDLDGANCHALIIARPVEDVNSYYLNLFLESRLGKNLLKRTQTGATLKHLNTTRIKDVTIPVPPKDEQKKIVEFLESERERYDTMIAQIEEGIERLKEYRTALITNAVTGQIDVRGEV